MDGYAQDVVEKLSYKYKVGAKGVKRELPYINKIALPKKSKNIISLEVLARKNDEGAKYMKNVSDEIILDANKKIHTYITGVKKQIKLYEDDLHTSEKNYENLKKNIDMMNEKVVGLSKIDPALAAIYTIQVGQKDLTLNEIKNSIIEIKNKDNMGGLKESISSNNVHFTKMIDKIQILDNPIKPKKKLIVVVAFITSLIFSIFLVFFLNFIEGMKKEDE